MFIDKMRSRSILDNELATSNMNRLGMSTPTKICLVRGQKAKSTPPVMLEIWKHTGSNPNLACRISDETAINDLAIRLGSRRRRRKKEGRTRKRRTRTWFLILKVDSKENEGSTLYLRDRLRFCESLSFFQSRWTAKNQKSISTERDWNEFKSFTLRIIIKKKCSMQSQTVFQGYPGITSIKWTVQYLPHVRSMLPVYLPSCLWPLTCHIPSSWAVKMKYALPCTFGPRSRKRGRDAWGG